MPSVGNGGRRTRLLLNKVVVGGVEENSGVFVLSQPQRLLPFKAAPLKCGSSAGPSFKPNRPLLFCALLTFAWKYLRKVLLGVSAALHREVISVVRKTYRGWCAVFALGTPGAAEKQLQICFCRIFATMWDLKILKLDYILFIWLCAAPLIQSPVIIFDYRDCRSPFTAFLQS